MFFLYIKNGLRVKVERTTYTLMEHECSKRGTLHMHRKIRESFFFSSISLHLYIETNIEINE